MMRPSSIMENLPLVVFVDPALDILIMPAPQVALTTMVLVFWLIPPVSFLRLSKGRYLPDKSGYPFGIESHIDLRGLLVVVDNLGPVVEFISSLDMIPGIPYGTLCVSPHGLFLSSDVSW
jgi:hypothetical protein